MRRWIGWCWLALAFVAPVLAQEIPAPLQGWQDWVLHDEPEQACPRVAGDPRGTAHCIWPGVLALDVGTDLARFSLQVRADAPTWMPLPGESGAWPQDVNDNDRVATVLSRDGVPMVWLEPGSHVLEGRIPWSSRPADLALPPAIVLVRLTLSGATVDRVERHGDRLTLGEGSAEARRADALTVRVYRRLVDGVPATLQSRLQIDVAGGTREAVLGPALPAGFVATALAGDLPARLEADGHLRVQLRPGRWWLDLGARALQPLAHVEPLVAAAPWPDDEIWSFEDAGEFRHARIDGRSVDAAASGVPGDWLSLPAYAVRAGAGLDVETASRGIETSRGDRLSLTRGLWLDFDGGGLTAVDDFGSGTLQQTPRLDVIEPWQLLHAAQSGDALPVGRHDGAVGIEVRQDDGPITASLRLAPSRGAFPAAGWNLPLDAIDATLHLPAGYRLIGAPGVDRSPDSWVAGWSLFDLFAVALIALLAGRLLGWPMALLTAGYLVLAHDEGAAPRWTLLLSLGLLLCARALPAARLGTLVRRSAGVMLALAVLCALPFAASELRLTLYPQLEGTSMVDQLIRGDAYDMAVPPPAPPTPSPSLEAVSARDMAESVKVKVAAEPAQVDIRGSGATAPATALPSSVPVQAGPGIPSWEFGNDYRLQWSGPVTTTQTARLVIAPAWLVRVLRVVMLVLLATLLARLLREMTGTARRPRWRAGAAAAVLLLVLAPMPAVAQELPTPELLQQLRERLLEAPRCAPDCATVARADARVDGRELHLDLVVHVAATTSVPVPHATEGADLRDVAVDGRPASDLLGDGNAGVLLRLDRGVHVATLRYAIRDDHVAVGFPLPPQRIQAVAPGWTLQGIDGNRLAGDSLGLHRQPVASGDAAEAPSTQVFAPYVRVRRAIHFGPDWSVRSIVERIAPESEGFSVRVPLLPGEHVSSDRVRVHDGIAEIGFRSGESVVSWSSVLDRGETLDLIAPSLAERVEEWSLTSAPQWHIEASGVPAVAGGGTGRRFQPLPGETLHVIPSQPEAVAGGDVAFDAVVFTSGVGARAVQGTLLLTARSTRGGNQVITLPATAELVSATRDGKVLPLSLGEGKLGLPLLPGSQRIELSFSTPDGIGTMSRTAALSLGAPAANIRINLDLPQDRWVWWTTGPMHGPAVLYWGQLLLLVVVAWLLARFAPTPLRFRHWLLLGLGFSAFNWGAFALVAAWLILFGVRERRPPSAQLDGGAFNLLQIGLAMLTLLALVALVAAVPQGLLGLPDMHVTGMGSNAWHLVWFADRALDALPSATVFSLPLWAYKVAMLAWALWLANALIGWLRWAFAAWSTGGYWRRRAAPDTPANNPADAQGD